ncbi:MAG TPA: NAD-dependent succinate-semialdehyde dehydrogenase [Mycobacterium sp.]|jgi:succinate-semialdehyde dehydrogenase/glutarate-semialdehyde dehydrogenase|nr:NAD-dependent succinate-semialdehyde dehydrogenase [Mycobacterium sp.]
MTTLQQLEEQLGPVARGPMVAGEVLTGPDTIAVLDPATEGIVAEIAGGDVATGRLAVDAAASAMVGWAASSPRQRSDVLRRAFDLMVGRVEALATLIVLENGKAFTDARSEVLYAAEFFRWYSEEAVRLSGEIDRAPAGTNRIMVLRQPIGVSLLITPWNFPAAMATRKIGPALAAGCAVVLKPASETPLTALAMAGLMAEAGLPAGVLNVVPSRRSDELASRVLDDERVRKLSFTGSTEVGRRLLEHAARTVVSPAMELGGNAPFVVFDDADLDDAVAGAMIAKLRNGGSACTAANRFIVHASIADDFAARLAAAMSQLTVGPGLDLSTDIGPLVNAKTRDKVSHLVQGALDGGAKALVGARVPDSRGFYYMPTVLAAVPHDAEILDEEIFGPVAPVTTFDNVDEAIALANATEYGLVSYVYTSDLRTGLQVGERLDSGMVGINRPVVSDPAAPFGGTKQSGLGREGGHEGMLEFTESKYLAIEW